jgi:hypothetical protein
MRNFRSFLNFGFGRRDFPGPARAGPHTANLRIAPSFPELKDVSAAADGIAISIEYAVAERLSSECRMLEQDGMPAARLADSLPGQ